MSAMHKLMQKERQMRIEKMIGDLVFALADGMHMSVPSAVYAVQQVTARHLAGWDRKAAVKNLRATARFINGDIDYAELLKIQEKQFDLIAAGYERLSGADEH